MAQYDLQQVKTTAIGHWPAILNRIAGIDDDYLTSRSHGPCPKCGGVDRWRCFDDWQETGGAICNQCGKHGDGIAVVQWMLGIGFPDALKRIADFLGVNPESSSKAKSTKNDPTKALELLDWTPQRKGKVAIWCQGRGFTIDAVEAFGGRLGRYTYGKEIYSVIAFPLQGEKGETVGWTMYQATGGKLPRWDQKSKSMEWLKVKTIKKGT